MNAFLSLGGLAPFVLDTRRSRAVVAVVVAGLFTFIAQWYVFFDGYWSIVANIVLFAGAALLTFYALPAFVK